MEIKKQYWQKVISMCGGKCQRWFLETFHSCFLAIPYIFFATLDNLSTPYLIFSSSLVLHFTYLSLTVFHFGLMFCSCVICQLPFLFFHFHYSLFVSSPLLLSSSLIHCFKKMYNHYPEISF